MSPTLSIAINSYRNPELLKLCLESVLRSVRLSGLSFEVLVTDSATQEETEILMREDFKEVRFFPHSDNVGFGALVNEALKEYRGEYLILLNADIVMTEGTIETIVQYLKSHQDVGLVGLKQLNFNGTLQPTCLRFYRPWTIVYRRTWLKYLPWAKQHLQWFTMAEYDHKTPRAVDWVMGSAVAGRREALQKVGPMDPRFFMYMEDVDWCRRFWEAGLKVVYLATATVYHYHAKGSAQGGFIHSLLFNRLTWHHIVSAVKYFWKYRRAKLPSSDIKLDKKQ